VNCQEAQPLLHAYLDRELDPANTLLLEQHMGECAGCAERYRLLERLRSEIVESDLAYQPGKKLEKKIAALGRGGRAERWWSLRSLGMALATVAAAVVVFFLPVFHSGGLEEELVDNHIRSLQPGHLVDVPSSDQHTVKPWFQGKVSFTPNVPDLASQGFPLVGGRLEVIGARQAAAIVYKRREHVINVFVLPEESDGRVAPQFRGYHIIGWKRGGLRYWAVSDLNEAELREFVEMLRK
jgi:anti-sigma factor RsiW